MERVKKAKPFMKEYGPVVLWKEDCDELFDVFKRVDKDAKISNRDYQYDSVDDLQQHVGSGVQVPLDFSGSNPYAQVEFSRMFTKFFVASGPTSAQFYHEIDDILTRCQRRLPILYSAWFYFPLVLTSFSLMLTAFIPQQWFPSSFVPWLLGLNWSFAMWFLWASFVNTRRHSIIMLVRHSEARPFFERNRDQLLMVIIGAIIGGLVTFAVTQLKDRYFPPASGTSAPKQPG